MKESAELATMLLAKQVGPTGLTTATGLVYPALEPSRERGDGIFEGRTAPLLGAQCGSSALTTASNNSGFLPSSGCLAPLIDAAHDRRLGA